MNFFTIVGAWAVGAVATAAVYVGLVMAYESRERRKLREMFPARNDDHLKAADAYTRRRGAQLMIIAKSDEEAWEKLMKEATR